MKGSDMQKAIIENDRVSLIRKSVYNHRTTPDVSWVVFFKPMNIVVAETKTKKEALTWYDIYTTPNK